MEGVICCFHYKILIQVLRIQRKVHAQKVHKAFEVPSRKIIDETPALSAEQLNQSYQSVVKRNVLANWQALFRRAALRDP